jgi:outer membrane protein assembly factor BamB
VSRTLLLGALATLSLPAADWPRFRGPNGGGIATDKGIPTHWSENDGILWKTPIPGVGNSSPIVSGDRVFLQAAAANGGERQLVCVSATTGKILWSTPVPGSRAHINAKNSFASSTPATDGERVYACFWDGQEVRLHAFNFQGKEIWKQNLGSFKSQHGPGESPIVHDGLVFLNHDQDGAAKIVAFDAKTGKIAWEAPRRAFRTCYSTPFILDRGSKPQLIVASTAGITSYDPHSGKVNWDWAWKHVDKPLRTVGSPIYAEGLIIATSGDGDGSRHMVAVRVNDGKPELAWQLTKRTPYVPTLVTVGDHLFFVNDGGVAGCLATRTGETIWEQRLGKDVSSSPIVIDNRVYVADEEGTMYVFRAADKLELLAKNAFGEPVFATPAVANNRLYIRGKNHLFCIGDGGTHAGNAK